jgi:hypothetical protein
MEQLNKLQSGTALILLVTLLVLGTTSLFLYQINSNKFQIAAQKQTALVLAQAKEALLGFALTYVETHLGEPIGYLPCPDNDGDGSADAPCSTKGYSVIGRFPWRTLGLLPLRDGSGECLWYAVSGTYKDNPKQILTKTTQGLFFIKNINGDNLTSEPVIAIIFAPEKLLDKQGNRSSNNNTFCGNNIEITNYLDSLGIDENGDGLSNYTIKNFSGEKTDETSGNPGGDELPTATPSVFIKAALIKDNKNRAIFNDSLMLITPKDFEPIYKRM